MSTHSTFPPAARLPAEHILQPRDSQAEESPYWFWQIILVLTAWLHLHFHLPHRGCALLLKVLRSIFVTLRHVPSDNNIPITLTTTFKKLGLNEEFEIRAICNKCRRAYPENSPADLVCSHCNIPLFKAPSPPTNAGASLLDSTRPRPESKPRPALQGPYLPLSTQLVEFLSREGNEVACESYLKRKRVPGKMSDIQDGEICQSLKAPDGRKFFDTAADRPDPDELRIGLCFGEDGFAFTRTNDAGSHTTGAASFCVTALPPHQRQVRLCSLSILLIHHRYRPRNLLLTHLGPGPHEETCDEFQRTMASNVTELLMLYDDGILVKTPKFPNGQSSGAIDVLPY
ncbi:hypothetical protein R3P38DRAFT_2575750 [Favolaschia claudopus]|uniref:Uncharacterized protein n=1 Tax=Favolaschia claudopus TaxID=2862362 RepID=A0AAV9ZK49_9AGAR